MNLTNAPTANKETITDMYRPKPAKPEDALKPLTPANPATPATPATPAVSPMSGKGFIQDLYKNNALAQKETLKQNYEKNLAEMANRQREAKLRTDANLNRTNVESRQAARNFAETQNAYGLSGGAMAQARNAQQNQLQKDLTLLRLAQNEYDAKADRDRALLQNIYLSDQAKVDAENNANAAKDLYELQMAAGELMAGKGDYTRLGEIYGLTPEELAKLMPPASSGGGGSSGGGWSWNRWADGHRNSSPSNKESSSKSTYIPYVPATNAYVNRYNK